MKKIITLLFAVCLFVTKEVVSQTPFSGAPGTHDRLTSKIIAFDGNIDNGKIELQWSINENEATDRFDIEKSTDGVNFSMAALVFTSEKTGNENYMFYERFKKDKPVYYRLKLYGKSKDISYSKVLKL